MRVCAKTAYIGLIAMAILASGAQAARLKDIANIEGVRTNQLIGYGLIVGLDGTGDSQQTKFTPQSVVNMLEKQGIKVSADMKVKNVAAVMVTATLPPFARPGSTIDVVVSSLGDARSLQGGTLLQTPLQAANGEVYAVAQGPVTVGGFSAGGSGGSVTKNHSTAGRVPGGAIVERETRTDIAINDTVNITLNSNDFTTASRTATAIDKALGGQFAKALDGNVVSVAVPDEYKGNLVSLIASIESVEVKTDAIAKVIVNERTGTIIIGGQARITPCLVGHGSLTVSIAAETSVSQPAPLGEGQTAVVTNTQLSVEEQRGHLVQISSGSTIEELARALNALKVTPRDLISILQAIKAADALQAQLEVI